MEVGILLGDVRTGQSRILINSASGPAVGTEYEHRANRLWVAGGPSGEVRVYDASTGDLLQTYTFSPAGFLNDLVVTRLQRHRASRRWMWMVFSISAWTVPARSVSSTR